MLRSMIFVTFQVLVIDYKLTYPSGTATAVLINGFHTPRGEENAKYGTELTLC
jgi:uncharacterized oligopeptide transporter (OPT) family protein